MSAGWPTLIAVAPSAMRLTRPASTLPVPTSMKRVTPCGVHEGDALAPADGPGHLLDEGGADRLRVLDRRRPHVGDQRRFRRTDVDRPQRRLHRFRRGLHQRAMEGGADRQEHRALGAGELGELHRPLDRGLGSRDHDLPAAVVVGRLADGALEIEVARGLGGNLHGRAEVESEQRRHRAFADRDRLLHRLAAQAQEPRRVLERDRARGAQRGIFAERMAGDEGRVARRSSKPASVSSARSAAMLAAISAGCALAVSVSSASGPSNMSWERFCDSAASTRSNTSRAAGNASARALPMPTACDP